jgi:predicted hydrocarbon binding protein
MARERSFMPSSERKASSVIAQPDLSSLNGDQARNLLAAALAPDPRSGILRLSGQPAVIIRPEVIVNIQRQLEQTIGGSAKGVMYLAGERSSKEGVAPVRAMSREPEGPLTFDAAKRMNAAFSLLGWGRAEVTLFDSGHGRFTLRIANSPIALAYGSSKKPVCHFLAGWAAGMGRDLIGRELLCEEVGCAAQGKDHCEFDIRPMPS